MSDDDEWRRYYRRHNAILILGALAVVGFLVFTYSKSWWPFDRNFPGGRLPGNNSPSGYPRR